MGTTTSTNISLIKPDTDESIREDLPTFDGWATQNGANCDVIDGLFRASDHSWVPTWTGSSNPVLGAGGLIEGKYIRLFPRMVVGFFRIYTGGAGFTVGTGGYSISVPVPVAAELNTFSNEITVGKAGFFDSSAAATSSAFTVVYSSLGGNLFLRQPSNDVWSATSPVVPGQQDRINGYFMYPTSTP